MTTIILYKNNTKLFQATLNHYLSLKQYLFLTWLIVMLESPTLYIAYFQAVVVIFVVAAFVLVAIVNVVEFNTCLRSVQSLWNI